MVFIDIFRAEALPPSVKDTPRATLSADDAEGCPIINKTTPVQHVVTQPPEPENVIPPSFRQLVPKSPKQKRYRHRQNQIFENCLKNL